MAKKAEEISPEDSLGVKPSQGAKSARQEGNDAYQEGSLENASLAYLDSIAICDQDMRDPSSQPKALKIGQLVEYSTKGYFGVVMSVFPLFDEYFLKDLGSNQAIWVGDAGGTLQRFDRKDLIAVSKEMVDFRLAVYCNLAVVSLRAGNNQQTLVWCDRALCINGRAPKALLRKGAALLKLNQPGPASDVLATALEEMPDDIEVRRLLREAKKRRSPTWVCVSGCCGPWGIVCGGPVAETMASVVAPARRIISSEGDKILDPSTDAATDTTAGPEVLGVLGEIGEIADTCSSCSSDSDSEDEEDPAPKPAAKSPWAFVLEGGIATSQPSQAVSSSTASTTAAAAAAAAAAAVAVAVDAAASRAPTAASAAPEETKASSPALRQRTAASNNNSSINNKKEVNEEAPTTARETAVEEADFASKSINSSRKNGGDDAVQMASKPKKKGKDKAKAQADHTVTILFVIAGVSSVVAVAAALWLVNEV